jgi:hypothetical protein
MHMFEDLPVLRYSASNSQRRSARLQAAAARDVEMDRGENTDDRDDSIACTRVNAASIAQQTAAGSQMHRAGAPEGQQQQQLQGEAFQGVLIDGFQVPQVRVPSSPLEVLPCISFRFNPCSATQPQRVACRVC